MITEAGPFHLRAGSIGLTCKLHPAVLVTICDSYIRRKAGMRRIIGTLLGTATEDSIIVKDCFALPHDEGEDQVKLDVVHHGTMLDLHQRVHPKHTVVGWFATGVGEPPRPGDALIHKHYAKSPESGCGIKSPVHVVVDTTLQHGNRLSIKAYMGRMLSLNMEEVALEFVEIPNQVLTNVAESVALNMLRKEEVDVVPSDTENFQTAFKKLHELVDQCHEYVSDVVSGRREPDVSTGRYLADVMASIPCSNKEQFKQLFDSCTKDTMLVMYLSSLIRSHIALAEKLATCALPLA